MLGECHCHPVREVFADLAQSMQETLFPPHPPWLFHSSLPLGPSPEVSISSHLLQCEFPPSLYSH
jgi:hypothetical protein